MEQMPNFEIEGEVEVEREEGEGEGETKKKKILKRKMLEKVKRKFT